MACNVYVLTEEGEAQLLMAGSTPPEWALPQLGEHTLQREESEPEGDDESDDESDDDGKETVTIPPAKGPGSSAKAWADYAKSQGFDVLEDAKAAEIREALAEAGIPVE
ncbi:hypothetical protein P2P98_03150 [Microbacterium sp. Kw_RZR3]|uniref:hypothetical protein n=1 Tax=Microbacterium sp. Kw_RZR3 TaxID=3032903 RepID=UPI0023DC7D0E|nr:hypothetical protein [Microbacterium sp. Kw_RZR3]MDF2045146.1 hypothetical protein [Microbacterium sp. Kw_RZR3]